MNWGIRQRSSVGRYIENFKKTLNCEVMKLSRSCVFFFRYEVFECHRRYIVNIQLFYVRRPDSMSISGGLKDYICAVWEIYLGHRQCVYFNGSQNRRAPPIYLHRCSWVASPDMDINVLQHVHMYIHFLGFPFLRSVAKNTNSLHPYAFSRKVTFMCTMA